MDEFKFNPYKVLDLPRNASESEIKKRYKMLAKKYHPDKIKKEDVSTNPKVDFKSIEKAFELLMTSDPTAKYKVELGFDQLKEDFDSFVKQNEADDEMPEENPVNTVDKSDLKVEESDFDPELINRLQKERDQQLFNIAPVMNNFESSIFNQLFDHNKKAGKEMIKYEKPNKLFSQSSAINDNSFAEYGCYDNHIENPDPVKVDMNRFTKDESVITVDKIDCDQFNMELERQKSLFQKELSTSSDSYQVHDKKFFDLY